MITKKELFQCCFGGQPDENDPRIDEILNKLNIVRKHYGKPLIPSCFYRSKEWDIKKGRSGKSTHCQLMAVDFKDDGKFAKWCLDNLGILAQAGLWMEDPRYTKGWVHLDSKPRKNRVFIPY